MQPRIGILLLHGYGLSGSGSNVYTRHLCSALHRLGARVHVVCQDHGEPLPFVATMTDYDESGVAARTRAIAPSGVHLHRPAVGPVLPVYNWDRYPGFDEVAPFHELSDDLVERYVAQHVRAVRAIVEAHSIDVMFANHVVAMPEVARRIHEATGVPYAVMPHGSAIEYVVRRDSRFAAMAEQGLRSASAVVVGGDEMLSRLDAVWSPKLGHRAKAELIRTGVDLMQFHPRTQRATPSAVAGQSGSSRASMDEFFARCAVQESDDDLLAVVDAQRRMYSPTAADRDVVEELAGAGFGQGRVVFFGGKLVAGKGVHALIAAMAGVADAHLVLAGQGTFREALELVLRSIVHGTYALFERVVRLGWALEGKPRAPLRHLAHLCAPEAFAELHQRAVDSNLGARVHFLGFLPHETLAAVLRQSDVSVLPSAVPEAYPLSLLESLASGVFPVVADHGGAAQMASEWSERTDVERSMLAVDPGADVMVGALRARLNARLRSADGPDPRARQLAEDLYGWPSIGSTALRLFERIAA
ncbi:MAG: glycosyltransferase [Myxococcota bacterium]